MAELVDAHGSGPCAARCGGSSPSVGTKCKKGVCESRLPFFTPMSKAPACFAGGTRKAALASAAGVAERDRATSVGTQCKKGVCESRLPFFTPMSKAPACFARGTRKDALASAAGVAERDRATSVGTNKKGLCGPFLNLVLAPSSERHRSL